MHAFTHKHQQAHKHRSSKPLTPHPCLHAFTHMHMQAHKNEPSKPMSACFQGAGATNTHIHITNIQLQLTCKHSLRKITSSKPMSACFANASPMRKLITHIQSHTPTQTQKTHLRSLRSGALQPPALVTHIQSHTHTKGHQTII